MTKITCSGKRTVSHDSWSETDKMVLDKVLSDERTTAYASDIEDITYWWSDCKDCNWYKSRQTILSEARLSILNMLSNVIEFVSRTPTQAGKVSRSFPSMRNWPCICSSINRSDIC